MKERPIIFSAPMVRAILEGRKTQTRRALKIQPARDAWASEDVYICPYGQPGDHLWVRESGAWRNGVAAYAATQLIKPLGQKWKSSIHMPRWASRITLRITDIRLQWLQEISEEDAKAEGVAVEPYVPVNDAGGLHACGEAEATNPRDQFRDLWNGINGHDAWDKNPWVWAISFERVKP